MLKDSRKDGLQKSQTPSCNGCFDCAKARLHLPYDISNAVYLEVQSNEETPR